MARANLTYISVIFVAVVTVASCKFCSLHTVDCGSKNGKIYSVQINETCNSDHEGVLQKGTNVSVNFTFSSNSPEKVLTSVVHGKIGVLPFITFPMSNPDACKDSGLTCPIKANTKYQYLPLLEIKDAYPAVRATVKWELQDPEGNDIFCIEMIANIVEKH